MEARVPLPVSNLARNGPSPTISNLSTNPAVCVEPTNLLFTFPICSNTFSINLSFVVVLPLPFPKLEPIPGEPLHSKIYASPFTIVWSTPTIYAPVHLYAFNINDISSLDNTYGSESAPL